MLWALAIICGEVPIMENTRILERLLELDMALDGQLLTVLPKMLGIIIIISLFTFVMSTEKHMRSKETRALSWSTCGAQLLFVETLAYIALCFPLILLACFFCWLVDADSVQICLIKMWTHFVCSPVPNSVQLFVLAVNLWTVLSCTFLVLSSITRILFCSCILAFWTRLGCKGESKCMFYFELLFKILCLYVSRNMRVLGFR